MRYADDEFKYKSLYNSCKICDNLIKEYATYWASNQCNSELRTDVQEQHN